MTCPTCAREHDVIALSELRTAPWNPRTITKERFDNLRRSLAEDPGLLCLRPILAYPADGKATIYAGNMRFEAAKALGAEWCAKRFGSAGVPGELDAISEDEARRRALRDNGQWGDWQEQQLAEILYGMKQGGQEVDTLGFDEKTMARLLASVGGTRMGGEDDDEIAPPAEPVTRPGDLIALGPHRLICGDATDPGTVARLFGGDQAGLLWTDPPYGVAYQTKLSKEEAVARHRRTDGKEVSRDDLTPEQTQELIAAALRIARERMRPGAAFYVCSPSGDMELHFRLALRDAGLALRQSLVWVKDQFVMGRHDYHYRHETLLYGWKDGAAHTFNGDRTLDTVWEVPRPRQSEEHPTMKPIELVERSLRNSSRADDVVYDPFAGSGTTVLAAEKTGRRALAAEIDPGYCDVVVARWEKHSGKRAERPQREEATA